MAVLYVILTHPDGAVVRIHLGVNHDDPQEDIDDALKAVLIDLVDTYAIEAGNTFTIVEG